LRFRIAVTLATDDLPADADALRALLIAERADHAAERARHVAALARVESERERLRAIIHALQTTPLWPPLGAARPRPAGAGARIWRR